GIVERCLAKEPEERFASTKDLARDLRSLRDHLSETSASETMTITPPARRSRAFLPAIALLAGVVAGIAGLKLFEQTRPVSRTKHQRLTFRRRTIVSARFAPDGRS